MPRLHLIGKIDRLKEGEAGCVTVEGKTIAVFRFEGKFYAIDDSCPHMGAPLSSGSIQEDGTVACPWHYWRFRLSDGAWADNPRIRIGCYRTEVIGEDLHIELPD